MQGNSLVASCALTIRRQRPTISEKMQPYKTVWLHFIVRFHYLPWLPGGLLPRPPPEGLPVVDGQLPPVFPPLLNVMALSFLISSYSDSVALRDCRASDRIGDWCQAFLCLHFACLRRCRTVSSCALLGLHQKTRTTPCCTTVFRMALL